jgi:putative ABC transport system permease protein
MDSLFHDVRYGFRMLLKHRGFAFISILALALGIGANTAIFSVVNAVLFRPLPYKDPARLVTVLHEGGKPVAPANFFDWRAQSQVFEAMAAAQIWEPTLTGKDQPEQLHALQMTADIFTVLGVNAIAGRTFNAGEDQPGNEHVAVLSHRFWLRKFNGDRSVIGQRLMLDGEGYTIVGVMPQDFQFAPFWATRAEVWTPLNLAARANDRRGQSLRVFARLKPGVTIEQAQSEMSAITRRLEQDYPKENKGLVASVESLHEKVVGKSRAALLILFGAVGFVLLIACANVANLMMARATARRKEIAVRAALGASRARIARQLLTESVMLSLAGGVCGLLLAVWGIEALIRLGPDNLPRMKDIGLDYYVLGFTLGLSVLTGIVFGLAPVLQTTRVDLNETLKEGGRSASDGGRRNRVRRLLVVSEMGLALMLLISGGLMIRSFLTLLQIDAGFNPKQVLTMTVSLAGSEHKTEPQRAAFFNELLNRVDALPGVQSASAINHLPLGGDVWTLGFTIEGRPAPLPGESQSAVYRIVRPNYFQTMGEALIKGRDFTERDTAETPGVVIINEAFARRYFPGEDPIGKRVNVSNDKMNPREIVGVIRDAKQAELTAAPNPETYLPHSQAASPRSMTLVVRASSDPAQLAGAVQREVWAIDKNLPVSEIRTMEEVVAESIGAQRFNMILLTLFASVALVLAAVGIYGVMSYTVTQRMHEIGVRMALGASRADILKLVVRQGMALALVGVGLGLLGAFAVTRVMSSLLFNVSPTDSVTFIVVSAVLTGVALLACYIPARRATRVDPMIVLRYE